MRPAVFAAGGTISSAFNGNVGRKLPFARKISGTSGSISWTKVYSSTQLSQHWNRITTMQYYGNYLYYIMRSSTSHKSLLVKANGNNGNIVINSAYTPTWSGNYYGVHELRGKTPTLGFMTNHHQMAVYTQTVSGDNVVFVLVGSKATTSGDSYLESINFDASWVDGNRRRDTRTRIETTISTTYGWVESLVIDETNAKVYAHVTTRKSGWGDKGGIMIKCDL